MSRATPNLPPELAGESWRSNTLHARPRRWLAALHPEGRRTQAWPPLWLQNKAGVIMHLTGTQTGVTLSLGRDEIIIEMAK
jgi:hypothetical protein